MRQPQVIGGDLRRDLAPLAAQAPRDATLVIFHSAVLAYVSSPLERAEFAGSIRSLCDFWVANEAPQIFPEIAARAGKSGGRGAFLLSVNGDPVAWAEPHGASLAWLADPARAAAEGRARPNSA